MPHVSPFIESLIAFTARPSSYEANELMRRQAPLTDPRKERARTRAFRILGLGTVIGAFQHLTPC
jgi:hypothetical protein